MKDLKQLRKQKHLSQIDLSQLAGCSPSTLLRIERYGHRPPEECCERIASALGVQVTDIWPQPQEATR